MLALTKERMRRSPRRRAAKTPTNEAWNYDYGKHGQIRNAQERKRSRLLRQMPKLPHETRPLTYVGG